MLDGRVLGASGEYKPFGKPSKESKKDGADRTRQGAGGARCAGGTRGTTRCAGGTGTETAGQAPWEQEQTEDVPTEPAASPAAPAPMRSAAACAPALLRRRSVMEDGPCPLLASAPALGSPTRSSSTKRVPPYPWYLRARRTSSSLRECGSRPRELPAEACAALLDVQNRPGSGSSVQHLTSSCEGFEV